MEQMNSLVAGDTAVPVGALHEQKLMGDLLSAPPGFYNGNYNDPRVLQQLADTDSTEMGDETTGTIHAVISEAVDGKPKMEREMFPAAHPVMYQADLVTTQDEVELQMQEPGTRWSSGNLRDVDDDGPGHTTKVFDRGRRSSTLC